jgi:nucleoside 2-deoxyribosyltransferase
MNIFVSAPFSRLCLADGGFEPLSRGYFEAVILRLKESGHSIYSAHLIENWGARLRDPKSMVIEDFAGIRTCDALVAYLGGPVSEGVFVELGWASALEKPVILLLEERREYSPLVANLSALVRSYKLYIDEAGGVADILNPLVEILDHFTEN